jgi:hypothetical protein
MNEKREGADQNAKTPDADDKIRGKLNALDDKANAKLDDFGVWWKQKHMWKRTLVIVLALCIFGTILIITLSSCSSGGSGCGGEVCR